MVWRWRDGRGGGEWGAATATGCDGMEWEMKWVGMERKAMGLDGTGYDGCDGMRWHGMGWDALFHAERATFCFVFRTRLVCSGDAGFFA